jgi:uncharacterized protein YdaU (DUF1376 family)
MALSGLMWWIDRWRKSTAYMDMTLEEQGAYRNLLDDAFLRGGHIPNDERILSRACGDVTAWKRVKDAVLSHFVLTDLGYRNETLVEVMRKTVLRVEKQKRYRDRKKGSGGRNDEGNDLRNDSGNNHGNDASNEQGYLDPDPDRELSKEQESSRHARAGVFVGKRLRVSRAQHALLERESSLPGVRLLALYSEWDADLVRTSEDFDTLTYIKRRAQDVASVPAPGTDASEPDWFDECKQLHGGECGARLRHHNRMLMDAEKARMRA